MLGVENNTVLPQTPNTSPQKLNFLTASILIPKVRHWPYWQVTSYSRMTQQLEAQRISATEFRLCEQQADKAQKSLDDEQLSDLPLFDLTQGETPWQNLPAGASIGDLMHRALEILLV